MLYSVIGDVINLNDFLMYVLDEKTGSSYKQIFKKLLGFVFSILTSNSRLI